MKPFSNAQFLVDLTCRAGRGLKLLNAYRADYGVCHKLRKMLYSAMATYKDITLPHPQRFSGVLSAE